MQIISLFYPPPFKTDFLEYSYFKKSNISDNNCFNTEKETCSLIEYNMLHKMPCECQALHQEILECRLASDARHCGKGAGEKREK